MALEIVYRDLSELIPYGQNARTHPKSQIAALRRSLAEFGWTTPMAISGNHMIAGHGRLMAAIEMRDAGQAIPNNPDPKQGPTVDLSHLTPAQQRAYVLADNRIAEQAGWDKKILAVEFAALADLKFDVTLTGFDLDFANRLTGYRGDADPEAMPEQGAVVVSKLGDIWTLGTHRLVCGDCTVDGVVKAALDGAKPHLMVTDPRYGVNYDPSWRPRAGVNLNPGKLGVVQNDGRADWRQAWALFPGDVAYVWHGGLHAGIVAESLTASGFNIRAQIIWSKDRFALSRGDYHWQHEPAWYAVRAGAAGHWNGDRSQTTIWPIKAREDAGFGHGTQKPVECMKRPIENSSAHGDRVYEPFSGSGTTIIAAEMTGRVCHAIEISPAYVDLAVRRWEQFTGQKAVHVETGMSIEALALSRQEVPAAAEAEAPTA